MRSILVHSLLLFSILLLAPSCSNEDDNIAEENNPNNQSLGTIAFKLNGEQKNLNIPLAFYTPSDSTNNAQILTLSGFEGALEDLNNFILNLAAPVGEVLVPNTSYTYVSVDNMVCDFATGACPAVIYTINGMPFLITSVPQYGPLQGETTISFSKLELVPGGNIIGTFSAINFFTEDTYQAINITDGKFNLIVN